MKRAALAIAVLTLAACVPPPPPPTPVTVPTASSSAKRGLPDADCDGLDDARDLCPEAAEDVDGFRDEDGCPDPDNDGDGILDLCDACPSEPETFNGFQDEDGCPDHGRILLTDQHIVIVQHIQFAHGKAEPTPASMPVVDAVAAVLKDHPELRRVGIIGHASNDEAGADVLSMKRAHAVVRLLVARGADPGKLTPEGMGARQPIVDPRSREGREKNRRVEMRVLERDEPPPPPRPVPVEPPPCREAPRGSRGCVVPQR